MTTGFKCCGGRTAWQGLHRLWQCIDASLAKAGLLVLFCSSVGMSYAQEATAPAAPADAGVIIEHFDFRYGLAHPELPPVETLGAVSVRLASVDGVWRPPWAAGKS